MRSHSINPNNQPTQKTVEQGPLASDKRFASDVFRLGLSFLNTAEQQSTTTVNKYWKNVTIETARQEEFTKLKKLAEVFSEVLPLEKQNQLRSIISRAQIIKNSANLIELRGDLKKVIEEFANVLYDLPDETINRLKQLGDTIKKRFGISFCFNNPEKRTSISK